MKSIFSLMFVVIFAQTGIASGNPVDNKEFENIIHKMMTEFNVPGLAVGVVDKNQALYMKGFGVRGIEDKHPVTPDTQFAIGSTSKAFTATALGMLVDQKVVDWDASIKANYLSDFELMDDSATQLVTIRDLLTHRTGLPRHDLVWYGSPFSRKELFRRLRYLEPTAGIREKTQYQNLMFMAAGYLTGRVMNTTWEDFVQQNIFSVIGMDNSNFSVIDMQKTSDFAYPHADVGGKPLQIPFRNIDAIAPAGSINSSIRDMGLWLRVQLNGGQSNGKQIVSSPSLAEIHKPQMVSTMLGFDKLFPEFGTEHYAMGWFEQSYHGKKLIHHGGGIDGFTTFVGFLPEYDRGIVVLGNTGGLVPYFVAFTYFDLLLKGEPAPWGERLKDLIKTPNFKFIAQAPLEKPIDSYFGTYSHPGYGEVKISGAGSNDELVFHQYVIKQKLGHKANSSFLPVIAPGQLLSDENAGVAPITFLVDKKGVVTEMLYKAEPATDSIRYEKIYFPLNLDNFLTEFSSTINNSRPLGPR